MSFLLIPHQPVQEATPLYLETTPISRINPVLYHIAIETRYLMLPNINHTLVRHQRDSPRHHFVIDPIMISSQTTQSDGLLISWGLEMNISNCCSCLMWFLDYLFTQARLRQYSTITVTKLVKVTGNSVVNIGWNSCLVVYSSVTHTLLCLS